MEETLDLVLKYAVRIGVIVLTVAVFWIALRPSPKKADRRGFDVKPPDRPGE